MASIPCAAYQVGHLHGTLIREHHSRTRVVSTSRRGISEETPNIPHPMLLLLTNSLSRLVHDLRTWSPLWTRSTNTKFPIKDKTTDNSAE